MDADKYLAGMRDCSNGVPHESGKGEDYDAGYSSQYQSEAIVTELGLRHEHNRKA